MEHLLEKLKRNGLSDIYPYHMPGHKRRAWGELPTDMLQLDVTEVEGFDNLHDSRDFLLALQKKAALLYGAEESFYLINGSTCGILSAISATVPKGGRLLIARNCHKSVYHGAYLRELNLSYIYPQLIEGFDVTEAVTVKQVEEALQREKSIDAVLIVSPTYEGRIADVASIAEKVHERGIPLIVDEAHGAHLGLSKSVCENSCRLGADLVIHSVHKTLPGLTQTALLHVNGKLVDREKLRRFLHIYQSSSPSYLLMASIDNALQYIEKNGDMAFEAFRARYNEMMEQLKMCKHLKFIFPDDKHQDLGKLVISVKDSSISGSELYNRLLQQYHLQLEMACESYALAMFTVNDSREGYERMVKALLELDDCLSDHKPKDMSHCSIAVSGAFKRESCRLSECWDRQTCRVPLIAAAGRAAGEFVNLYPPGIPLLVPGEIITEEMCRRILDWKKQGLTVQGINQGENPTITVLQV